MNGKRMDRSSRRLKVDPVFCVWPIDSNPRPGLALRLIRIQRKPTMWQKDILDNKSHFYILTSTLSGPLALISVTDWPLEWSPDGVRCYNFIVSIFIGLARLELGPTDGDLPLIRSGRRKVQKRIWEFRSTKWIRLESLVGKEKQSTGGRVTDLGFSY